MTTKKVAALIIGRGNNTFTDKNIRLVLGRPLLHWPALAAKSVSAISSYYISSDDKKILDAGAAVGFTTIVRPDDLATPTAQSADAVRHALVEIEKRERIDRLVVLHANVGTISGEMISDCLAIMDADSTVSAVVPSHYKDEYHPYRAKFINKNGYLENVITHGQRGISANRQELDPCVFFDHSFWVLDVEQGIKSSNGQPPWDCMGANIRPYITAGCFDVHDASDLIRTERWIIDNDIAARYPQ